MQKNNEPKKVVAALVGAPNSGKTTLYNWLTHSRFKTVNYPGSTVEYSVGQLQEGSKSLLVMDTPGTYSLCPKSADETVTCQAIYSHPEFGLCRKIVVVVDGTQLGRHLPLIESVRKAGFSFIIAVTMIDILKKNGMSFDPTVLEKEYGVPVVLIDGVLGGGVSELAIKMEELAHTSQATMLHETELDSSMLKRANDIANACLGNAPEQQIRKLRQRTDQLDQYLLHPIFGLVLFFGIMTGLFTAVFWLAAPLMDLIDGGFASLADLIAEKGQGSLFADFLGQGVVASLGAVFVFVPQIIILFSLIGLLEASGYLARAATLIDKPFSKIGMSGRSFVPILSGFACAVPALMATRNISSTRDRWITSFIIPLMSCSARLPVYALLISFLYKDESPVKAGLLLAVLYMGSILVGAIAAGVLNLILQKNNSSFFMMELPLYRMPRWSVLLKQILDRTLSYVKKAGPVIFAFAVIIWLGTTFPNYQAEPNERLQTSYLSTAGQFVEPIFEPMGADWRVGVGLMSAFAAREVFVSSLAVMFNVTAEDEDQSSGLLASMTEATNSRGEKIFTVPVVIGLMVFFMIALQCMTTVAVSIRETGSWKFAAVQLVAFNLVAYVLAVAIVQGAKLIGPVF